MLNKPIKNKAYNQLKSTQHLLLNSENELVEVRLDLHQIISDESHSVVQGLGYFRAAALSKHRHISSLVQRFTDASCQPPSHFIGSCWKLINSTLIIPRKMKVAANLTFMFGEAGSLLARYKAAQKAGFLAVECAFPYSVPEEEVARTLKETGLKQVLINSDPGNLDAGELGFASIPGQEERFRESLERSISYAKALSCRKLHIMSGKKSQDYDEAAHLETLEANLRHAVSRLSKEEIVGLIEPINPVSTPGYFLNHYPTAVALIEKIASPYLKLQLDIFHLQMITGNVTNNIKKLMHLTGHIQVAQAPHRHEPSCPGELDYTYVFKKLRDAGYDNYVGAEYSPSVKSELSLTWVEQCGLQY